MTVDSLHAVGFLTARLVEGGLLLNADLPELLDHHRKIVGGLGGTVDPFDRADPVGEFVALRAGSVDRLVEDGLARYLDDDRTTYCYTSRGAWNYVTSRQRRARPARPRELHRRRRRPGDPSADIGRPRDWADDPWGT